MVELSKSQIEKGIDIASANGFLDVSRCLCGGSVRVNEVKNPRSYQVVCTKCGKKYKADNTLIGALGNFEIAVKDSPHNKKDTMRMPRVTGENPDDLEKKIANWKKKPFYADPSKYEKHREALLGKRPDSEILSFNGQINQDPSKPV